MAVFALSGGLGLEGGWGFGVLRRFLGGEGAAFGVGASLFGACCAAGASAAVAIRHSAISAAHIS
jgi:hypothetical protein